MKKFQCAALLDILPNRFVIKLFLLLMLTCSLTCYGISSIENWKLEYTTGPLNTSDAAMAYNEQTKTIILFGGRDNTGTILKGTWSFNGQVWALLSPANSP